MLRITNKRAGLRDRTDETMRFFVLSFLFALLVISQINTVLDPDLWCHFKTGEYIVKNLAIPQADIFSYTLGNQPWIDHEWLSQILLYFVFSKFSWVGVNVLKAAVISLCFFIPLFFIASKYKRIVYAVFFILLSILALGYRSSARPEMFSYLFLCVFFCTLEDGKRLYILPFLQVLWANMHGYFILGPALIFLYFIGELISGNIKKAERLGAVFVMAGLVCLINPYFYKGAVYPIRVLTDAFSGYRTHAHNIRELMMPVSFGFKRYAFFWIFAILSSLTFLLNLKKARMGHGLVFLGTFLASYAAIRNMPFFIFTAMPLAVINLNEAKSTKNIIEKRYYAASILIISATVYFFISNGYYMFTGQAEFRKTESKMAESLMPAGACDFLESNKIKGRIFNSIDAGHYIAYRFYPEKRVFVDTRTELYKREFYQAYQKALNYPVEWEALQKRYDFDIVLIRHLSGGADRLLRYLYNGRKWVLAYYDESFAVFLHDAPWSKAVAMDNASLGTASLFEKIGETELAEEAYEKLLEADPGFLEPANNLAAIYINSGRLDRALEIIDRMLLLYPKSAELYCNKGAAYLLMGRKEQGFLLLQKSAGLNPYLRQVSYMLGLAYLEKGDLEKAEKQFVKYLILDPYDAGAHRALGNIYAKKGLLKESAAEYNESDKLEGK